MRIKPTAPFAVKPGGYLYFSGFIGTLENFNEI
jgi:hypothetical protein